MPVIRLLALALLLGCPAGDRGDVVDLECDLVGTEALPADDALPGSLAEGLALYDGMAGAWSVTLACADESAPNVTLAITPSARADFELETWDGTGCDQTTVARGMTAIVLSDWTHAFDTTVDTSVDEDGTVRMSGASSSVEIEINAWGEEIHGTIRVPWPDAAAAKDVASETGSDPMDCTFEELSPVE